MRRDFGPDQVDARWKIGVVVEIDGPVVVVVGRHCFVGVAIPSDGRRL